jgi:hypothetical protein
MGPFNQSIIFLEHIFLFYLIVAIPFPLYHIHAYHSSHDSDFFTHDHSLGNTHNHFEDHDTLLHINKGGESECQSDNHGLTGHLHLTSDFNRTNRFKESITAPQRDSPSEGESLALIYGSSLKETFHILQNSGLCNVSAKNFSGLSPPLS